jgi:hypothetical protein
MSDNHGILIASVVSLCDRATIDMGSGIDRVVGSIISISLKYINRATLLEQVVPGAYVDWDYIDNAHVLLGNKQNLLGDSDAWLQLLPYLNFGQLSIQPQELQTQHPPLWVLYKTVEEHMGHKESAWGFSDTCKLFLVSNLLGIPCKYVIERYIAKCLDCSSHVLCGKIMEAMAEERHEAEVYQNSLQFIMSK